MAEQHAAFVGSVPANYDRYLGPLLFHAYADDLAARLPVSRGVRVLEVACGTGIVTRRLLRRLGGQGTLVATDLNDAMIAHAQREVPADAALEWQQADGTRLPFPDGAFDVVVCQFGLMFFPDKAAGVHEAYRVLAAGGTYLVNVWDRMERNVVTRMKFNGCDGSGYDIDYDQDGTVVQFNTSYANQGGFMLLCTDDQPRTAEVRFNVSVNDGFSFNSSPCSRPAGDYSGLRIYNNTIVGPDPGFATLGYPSTTLYGPPGLDFLNNALVATDAGREIACDPGCRRNLFFRMPAAVLDGEDDDERDDQYREERAHGRDEQIEQVHLGGDRGRVGRKERQAVHVARTPRRSLRTVRQIDAPSARSVRMPPIRTSVMMARPYRPLTGS